MKLNLSDEPVTAELLAESLARRGSAVIAVNGTSMHPTLQMGWRVIIEPVRGDDLGVGEIGVFRTENHLTVHRLVFRGSDVSGAPRLVFRGDYNRVRERVPPDAVIARVVAVEIPGPKKGRGRIVEIRPDVLARFYRLVALAARVVRPLGRSLRPPGAAPPGRLGRAARSLFSFTERCLSFFLPERR